VRAVLVVVALAGTVVRVLGDSLPAALLAFAATTAWTVLRCRDVARHDDHQDLHQENAR